MKRASNPPDSSYNILSRGIYTDSDITVANIQPKQNKEQRKWIYVIARVIILMIALASILGSFMLATDGSWDIATLCFILGIFFFIPFILYGRKITELRKVKDSTRGTGLM